MSVARMMQQAAAGVSAGGSDIPDGISPSLDTWSGQGANSGSPAYSETRNVDISTYGGKEVRIVLHYVNGTTGTSYQGDAQVDTIAIPSLVTYSFDSDESWQTTWSGADSIRGNYNTLSSFTAVAQSTTSLRWNRISGTPSSSNTGINLGWSLYTETSGSGTSGKNYWARSPAITLPSSPTFSYRTGRYGNNIGTFNLHFDVIS